MSAQTVKCIWYFDVKHYIIKAMRTENLLKIAIVNSEFSSAVETAHGGIATYSDTLAYYLSTKGHTVHYFSRNTPPPPGELNSNLIYHQYGFSPPSSFTFLLLHYLFPKSYHWELGHARTLSRLLNNLIDNNNIDIVEFPEYAGLAYYYRKKHRVPYIVTFHTPSILVDKLNLTEPTTSQRFRYRMEEATIASADGFKSPSNTLKKYMSDNYAIDEQSIQHIRNPIKFEISDHITPASLDHKRFDILFSGRFEYRKGAGIILRAIKKILEIAPEITFSIAGATEFSSAENYRHALERSLSPDERKRVWFLGPLSYEHLLPLYRNSSVFLFPSLFENAPYSLFEAMSSGMPIIASDTGGVPEVITHKENGLLFSPDKPDDLVNHIRTLYTDRQLAQKLGNNAAKSIRSLLDAESLINEHIQFYQAVLERFRKTHS